VGGGVPVHIKLLALALLDSVYYPSDCGMLQLQCFLKVMRMAENLFFIPEREFVMFSAKPEPLPDANVTNSLSGTQKIFLPFS
jgi:hypothetical protein